MSNTCFFKPSQPLYRYGHPDYNKKDKKGFSDILSENKA